MLILKYFVFAFFIVSAVNDDDFYFIYVLETGYGCGALSTLL